MEVEFLKKLQRLNGVFWELPSSYRKKMRVPVRIVATQKLVKEMDDGALEQAINVAQLPGIIDASWMMPDAHWGYGFPVGGVAAFDLKDGVISPGGIGFDINCGMRLLVSVLDEASVSPKIKILVDRLFEEVAIGIGRGGIVELDRIQIGQVMQEGARWAVDNGFGWEDDIKHIEENGVIKSANPDNVSEKAVKRGIGQMGSLGSGNHYLEIQKVEQIYDKKKAENMGILQKGQVAVMIHCGSRGFGHQIATDYLNLFEKAMKKYAIKVDDKQLACAPFDSPEGKKYFGAMACAANFAFCNRQVIAHKVREVFAHVFGKDARDLGMKLVYDVAHNIAKIEEFDFDTEKLKNLKTKKLLVHRKGATRAFPGQPVIIGGSMETGSYLLAGTQGAMQKTFGSTAHGSGRTMSRSKAKKMVQGKNLQHKMREKGIYVKSVSYSGLAEEAGFAYKDINEVVASVSLADISQPVASFKPLGNIKG